MSDIFGLNVDYQQSKQPDSLGLGGVDSVIVPGSYQGLDAHIAANSGGENFYDAQAWDSTATKDTGGGGYGSTAISAVGTVVSTLISVAAKKDAIEQKTKESIRAMDATVREYEFMASVNEQQMAAVDTVVGDKMSQTGLERLKNKASLKASAAMSGASGGTTNAVVQEASIIEMMDNAVIVAQGRQQKTALSQKIQGQYMSAMNRLDNLAAGITSPAGAAFAMVDAGVSGFTKGYMALSDSQRRNFFGYTKNS